MKSLCIANESEAMEVNNPTIMKLRPAAQTFLSDDDGQQKFRYQRRVCSLTVVHRRSGLLDAFTQPIQIDQPLLER